MTTKPKATFRVDVPSQIRVLLFMASGFSVRDPCIKYGWTYDANVNTLSASVTIIYMYVKRYLRMRGTFNNSAHARNFNNS